VVTPSSPLERVPLERVPLDRETGALIAAARAQREAIDGVERLLGRVTGQAEDPDGTVAALVSARGELLDLWLREDAAGWGSERLGELIVQTAQAAAQHATQRAYDTLAPLLGDTVTAAMEGIGPPVPARSEHGPGIDPAEFQHRRDARMEVTRAPAPRHRGQPEENPGEDDVFSFDPATLRSDR
jgi:hypothetical protein